MHRAETIKKHFAPLLPTWSWWSNIKWFLFSSGIIEWVRYEYGERQNLSLLAVILTHTCIWYLNYPEENKGLLIFLFFFESKVIFVSFQSVIKEIRKSNTKSWAWRNGAFPQLCYEKNTSCIRRLNEGGYKGAKSSQGNNMNSSCLFRLQLFKKWL